MLSSLRPRPSCAETVTASDANSLPRRPADLNNMSNDQNLWMVLGLVTRRGAPPEAPYPQPPNRAEHSHPAWADRQRPARGLPQRSPGHPRRPGRRRPPDGAYPYSEGLRIGQPGAWGRACHSTPAAERFEGRSQTAARRGVALLGHSVTLLFAARQRVQRNKKYTRPLAA